METKFVLNALLLRRLARLLRLTMPTRAPSAIIVFLLLLSFAVGYEVSGYFTGLLSSKFYRVLVEGNRIAFAKLAWVAILTVLATAAIKSARDFVAKILGLLWRKNLVAVLHEFYYRDVTFFRINHLSTVDNPDQRMTQDVERFCSSATEIVTDLLLSPFKIGYYSYQAYSSSDWYGPLSIYFFFVVSTAVNQGLMSRVVNWVFLQEKGEGHFRFAHMNTRTQSESMAFYRAGVEERRKTDASFLNLLRIQRRLFLWQFGLNFSSNTFDYVGAILSYLVISIPIFNGHYKDMTGPELTEVISKNGFVCIMLLSSFSSLVDIASKISYAAGNAHRVAQLLEVLALEPERFQDDEEKDNEDAFSSTDHLVKLEVGSDFLEDSARLHHSVVDSQTVVYPIPGGDLFEVAFVLRKFSCDIPADADKSANTNGIGVAGGRSFLVKDLDFELSKGCDILVSGPSGVGKSSLLRSLFGLWPHIGDYSALKWPLNFRNPRYVVVLPQSPYILDDPAASSLISELRIPSSVERIDEEKAVEALKSAGLDHLRSQSRNGSWTATLSRGEKQKLGFARVLYHNPLFAIVDEATSSMDEETEEHLYRLCQNRGTTFLSVGHRTTLRKFHKRELRLIGDGNWEIVDIEFSQ